MKCLKKNTNKQKKTQLFKGPIDLSVEVTIIVFSFVLLFLTHVKNEGLYVTKTLILQFLSDAVQFQ